MRTLQCWGIAPGNTANDNTIRFNQMEAVMVGQEVDMGGAEVPVTAIPTACKYRNGFFIIPDATGVLARYPALDTIKARERYVTKNTRYSAWPQDKAHVYRNVLYVPFNEGDGHHLNRKVHIGYSEDDGQTWQVEIPVFPTVEGLPEEACFGAGVVRGQQLLIVKYQAESETPFRSKLLGRRLYEFNQMEITITPATGQFMITGPQGYKVGDSFCLRSWTGGQVGGVTVNAGPYVVTNSTDTGVIVDRVGAVSGGAVTGGCIVESVQGPFTEILFGGGRDFGQEVMHVAGLDPATAVQPTLFHSLAPRDDISRGGFYTCCHGGDLGTGTRLIKVSALLATVSTTRSVDWIRTIRPTQGVEPSVVYHDGMLFGTIRKQGDAGYPARFWKSDDELATPPVIIDAPSNPSFLSRQPLPIRVMGGEVYMFAGGTRAEQNGLVVPEDVPLYLFRATLSEVMAATTTWPFRAYRLGVAYVSATNGNIQTNATGMCSLAPLADGRRLLVAWSTEHAAMFEDFDGQPDVVAAIVDVSGWGGRPHSQVQDPIGLRAMQP